jgi:hypothetical protein
MLECGGYTFEDKFWNLFCYVIVCTAIGCVTILLKARHKDMIVWSNCCIKTCDKPVTYDNPKDYPM